MFASAACKRGEIYQFATSNIRKAQDMQQKDFDQSYLSNSEIKVGYLILLRSNKRKERKRGGGGVSICMAWSLYRFRYYNLAQLKLYIDEKTADTGDDTTKFTVAADNEKPLTLVNT